MENDRKNYIEIEHSFGHVYGMKIQDKIYQNSLPDVIVGNNPVELQEVYFSPQGKGRRDSYSYRPTVSIIFDTHLRSLSPLKSKLHKHDYFELMLIASDEFEMQIESQLCQFNKWDVCLLNRSTRHAEHFMPEAKVFYLALMPDYLLNWPREEGMSLPNSILFTRFFSKVLRDASQHSKDFIVARYTDRTRLSPLYEIIEEIRKEFENKRPGYQLFIRGLIFRLFSNLVDPEYYEPEYIDLGFDEGFSLAFSAKQILDKNKRRMTKLQLAERLNYNSEYINRVFKKHYGYTIPEYNTKVCMREAASILCNTNQHIHKICQQLGFTNRTHFYSLFEREFGCTPSDYRRKGTGN